MFKLTYPVRSIHLNGQEPDRPLMARLICCDCVSMAPDHRR